MICIKSFHSLHAPKYIPHNENEGKQVRLIIIKNCLLKQHKIQNTKYNFNFPSFIFNNILLKFSIKLLVFTVEREMSRGYSQTSVHKHNHKDCRKHNLKECSVQGWIEPQNSLIIPRPKPQNSIFIPRPKPQNSTLISGITAVLRFWSWNDEAVLGFWSPLATPGHP